YGIPFPAWHCSDCKHIILATPEQTPIDPQETPYGGVCPQCASKNIVPDTDVMDTWNTSSLTPYLCADLYLKSQDANAQYNFADNSPLIPSNSTRSGELYRGVLPMSMRPQAHDIIRTWAFDTIV